MESDKLSLQQIQAKRKEPSLGDFYVALTRIPILLLLPAHCHQSLQLVPRIWPRWVPIGRAIQFQKPASMMLALAICEFVELLTHDLR